jgi:DNA-binding LacI/PurR family transcriptional regulator
LLRCRGVCRPQARATTGLLAQGAIQAARERDLPVPETLSVVGFDNLPDAASTGLTTVHQPLADKGRIAARLLLEALDGTPRPPGTSSYQAGWSRSDTSPPSKR